MLLFQAKQAHQMVMAIANQALKPLMAIISIVITPPIFLILKKAQHIYRIAQHFHKPQQSLNIANRLIITLKIKIYLNKVLHPFKLIVAS